MPAGAGGLVTTLHVVAPEGGSDRTAWLERLLAAGSPPDVVTGLPACEVRRLPVASKVTDLVRRDRLDVDQFDAAAYRALEAGGELWGMPYAWSGDEIGVALDRNRFPRVGVPVASATPPTDLERQATGWSWPEFVEAMATVAADASLPGVIALERFGTVRSLPATWRARWSDAGGRIALADREPLAVSLRHFDDLRRDLAAPRHRAEAPPIAAASRGAPSVAPTPTLGIMRGPASAALGTGGRALMRAGRAAASSIEVEQASAFASALLMPMPRGAASVADVEPLLAAITPRADRRDSAWRLVKWLVEDGRLARAERHVPAWRAAQPGAVAELARPGAPAGVQLDSLASLLAGAEGQAFTQAHDSARVGATATAHRPNSPAEALVLGAIRRAPPRDPVLDGPAGLEARKAIGAGLRAWEDGEASADDALDALAPVLQAILDRTPDLLPA